MHAWLAHVGMEINVHQGELVAKLGNQPNLVIVGKCLEFETKKRSKIVDTKLAFWLYILGPPLDPICIIFLFKSPYCDKLAPIYFNFCYCTKEGEGLFCCI